MARPPHQPQVVDLRRPVETKKNRRWKTVAGIIAAALILLVAFSWQASRKEPGHTIRTVGKLVQLPTGENPTIATVSDKTKVINPFLKASENGDKVLLYAKAGKVILYRPSTNKVIAVGPLTTDPAYAQANGAKIVVRSASADTSKAQTAAQKIKDLYPQAKSVTVEPAAKGNYPKTLVIGLNEDTSDLADALVSQLNASKGVLPLGESKPDADVLVIVAN